MRPSQPLKPLGLSSFAEYVSDADLESALLLLCCFKAAFFGTGETRRKARARRRWLGRMGIGGGVGGEVIGLGVGGGAEKLLLIV